MRFSYCWAVPPEAVTGDIVGRYVLLRDTVVTQQLHFSAPGYDEEMVAFIVSKNGDPEIRRVVLDVSNGPAIPPPRMMSGRVIEASFGFRTLGWPSFPVIDATFSRWHGASVAGLFVGAMGCFIFGLYLRRWLRERKALASQPEQDMIA